VRIVSLLPSTTEILFAIGAGDDVAGIFHPEAFARHPELAVEVSIVGARLA
jgi:ABC-type Fe3+-hydroxamate transport system substrate-binding protein